MPIWLGACHLRQGASGSTSATENGRLALTTLNEMLLDAIGSFCITGDSARRDETIGLALTMWCDDSEDDESALK